MKTEAIKKAIALSIKSEHIFIATSDSNGMPHMAAAGRVSPVSGSDLLVEAWLCPGTVSNVKENKNIAIVTWDPVSDQGYQLLGTVEVIREPGSSSLYRNARASAPVICSLISMGKARNTAIL